jgi:hypothetical protein
MTSGSGRGAQLTRRGAMLLSVALAGGLTRQSVQYFDSATTFEPGASVSEINEALHQCPVVLSEGTYSID